MTDSSTSLDQIVHKPTRRRRRTLRGSKAHARYNGVCRKTIFKWIRDQGYPAAALNGRGSAIEGEPDEIDDWRRQRREKAAEARKRREAAS